MGRKMLEQSDPAFLSELLAIMVKKAGGEIVLGSADDIGPHELRFIQCVDDATGARYLKLSVQEYAGAMN